MTHENSTSYSGVSATANTPNTTPPPDAAPTAETATRTGASKSRWYHVAVTGLYMPGSHCDRPRHSW